MYLAIFIISIVVDTPSWVTFLSAIMAVVNIGIIIIGHTKGGKKK